MIILAIAAVLSSSAPHAKLTRDESQQVMGANSGDIYSPEYAYVTGDTRKIVRSADTYNHRSIKPKKKIAVRIIPQAKPVAIAAKDNGLSQIIARVKRENGIKAKS